MGREERELEGYEISFRCGGREKRENAHKYPFERGGRHKNGPRIAGSKLAVLAQSKQALSFPPDFMVLIKDVERYSPGPASHVEMVLMCFIGTPKIFTTLT